MQELEQLAMEQKISVLIANSSSSGSLSLELLNKRPPVHFYTTTKENTILLVTIETSSNCQSSNEQLRLQVDLVSSSITSQTLHSNHTVTYSTMQSNNGDYIDLTKIEDSSNLGRSRDTTCRLSVITSAMHTG
uniref:Uncharacterized protein n=1 Tax=Glossina austeni TaxID=7395 RepID=A0A1A9VD50_GLOAU